MYLSDLSPLRYKLIIGMMYVHALDVKLLSSLVSTVRIFHQDALYSLSSNHSHKCSHFYCQEILQRTKGGILYFKATIIFPSFLY